MNEWRLRLEEIFQRAIEKGKAREVERDTTLREQFWKSLRSERLKNATRVKYESLKSFEQLRKAVRAEENEMKLATNIAQQQARTQIKSEKTETVQEEKEDKLDLILKRVNCLIFGYTIYIESNIIIQIFNFWIVFYFYWEIYSIIFYFIYLCFIF